MVVLYLSNDFVVLFDNKHPFVKAFRKLWILLVKLYLVWLYDEWLIVFREVLNAVTSTVSTFANFVAKSNHFGYVILNDHGPKRGDGLDLRALSSYY